MVKLGDDLETQIEASVPFIVNLDDFSAFSQHGYLTVAQCALMIPTNLPVPQWEDKVEMLRHYYSLACVDIADGILIARHPQTHLPYTQYLRMAERGMFGPEGDEMPIATAGWLVSLDDAEGWLRSKGFDVNFDEIRRDLKRLKAGKAADHNDAIEKEAINWQSQARIIADECFDTDTRNSCRDSLRGYSKRVLEEMQKRGVKGPQGIINNSNTVMREALQSKKWWANKQK